jgi:alpha-1,2-mannosyltransferase
VVRLQSRQSEVEDVLPPALGGTLLAIALGMFGVALAATIAAVAVHPLKVPVDFNVYYHAGLMVRQAPSRLYTWHPHLRPSFTFTYTPFAAEIFAAGSLLSFGVLAWLTWVVSVVAVPVTAWLTFGALGWRGRNRAAAALALGAVGLWIEPVRRGLGLGQIELLLMLLIVWDLCQPDRRWWKGAGIGIAAGIKLVPLIFIPYLVLAGKLRQAAAASATLAATIGIGYVFLPQESDKWWLTGYFLSSGRVAHGSVPLNQSLLALLARLTGGLAAAMPIWRVAAVVVAVLGLAAAALLHRSGRPVQGWATCALTGLLVSPISWDQHWVWILPILAVLADLAVRISGAARWGYRIIGAITVIIFGDLGPRLGFFPAANQARNAQPIISNQFVLAGLALLVLALIAAWRAAIRPARGPWSGASATASEDSGQGTSDPAPGLSHSS